MAPVVYSGSLQAKKKSELQDIAAALKIGDQGTRDDLQLRIKKHLDNHQSTLEDNPRFAGLFGRKRRSVQPQALPNDLTSPEEETDTKPTSRDSRRQKALEPISESPPPSDLHESSAVSSPKKELASPERSSARKSAVSSPADAAKVSSPRRPASPQSPLTTLVGRVPAVPRQMDSVVRHMRQHEVLQNGAEMLVALRIFLSNSRNIWSLTAVMELFYVLKVVIPWKTTRLPLTPTGDWYSFSLTYPPWATFHTSAFWLVLLHWSIPTLIVPAIVGNLISFSPGANTLRKDDSPSGTQIVPFDPLTASIIRLAAQIAYPYLSIEEQSGLSGMDVLGFRWRVLNASIGLAFAFAEAIAGAPEEFAKTFFKEQRQAKSLLTEGTVTSTPSSSRKAITVEETVIGDEQSKY
ncbi:hypothetical protein AMATHDRAFT_62035 [Amanita thiersii Skay4041]|uniref:SAP domain-containing protein n=1 Tax=Amanita thiersii Skay4041 TaxID=703135 RepID=A0A2A9NQM0_9AGAR|nr:hypothetical protein AMATHDRAFT_62035 [Amanita thiersii Skay4041]